MGYLTTFTIYNDGIHLIKEHPQDFAEGVFSAANEFRNAPIDIAIGGFVNLIRVQRSRHADDNTIYVHMGNCVVELNPYSEETKRLAETKPEFFKKLVQFLSKDVKELKTLIKKKNDE